MASAQALSNIPEETPNPDDGIALNVRDLFLVQVNGTAEGMALRIYDAQRLAQGDDADTALLRSIQVADPVSPTFDTPQSDLPGRSEAVAAFRERSNHTDGLDAARGIGVAMLFGVAFWGSAFLFLRSLLG